MLLTREFSFLKLTWCIRTLKGSACFRRQKVCSSCLHHVESNNSVFVRTLSDSPAFSLALGCTREQWWKYCSSARNEKRELERVQTLTTSKPPHSCPITVWGGNNWHGACFGELQKLPEGVRRFDKNIFLWNILIPSCLWPAMDLIMKAKHNFLRIVRCGMMSFIWEDRNRPCLLSHP